MKIFAFKENVIRYLKTKKYSIIFFALIFLVVFLIATTNTIPVYSGLAVYLTTLLFIFLITLFTDKVFKSKFKFIALLLFTGSFVSIVFGFMTFSIQKKWNAEKAKSLILEIEIFKKENGNYPKDEKQVNLPTSNNGFHREKFEYYIPNVEEDSYVIKYFDGFWITKVYVSNDKRWYDDD